MKTPPPWYVLTGGPCTGKTTTINELKARGYDVLPESARTVIAAEIAAGKTIETLLADPQYFEHTIIAHQLELMAALKRDTVTFLDRGIPDNIAYYRRFGLDLDETIKDALSSAMYRKVFLLDMIDFSGDAERYETDPEDADELHRGIEKAYTEMGYEIVRIPLMPVNDRVDLILQNL